MASEKIIKMKEEEVKKLAEKMKDASLVLLTDYRGISVADDTALRKTVRTVGAEYCVIKNNITRRALKECGIEIDEALVGPTAVIITQEEYLPALKAIYKYSKSNQFYSIKGGVLEGKVSSVEELNTLAQLPSREELISKFLGSIQSPIANFARVIKQIAEKLLELETEEIADKRGMFQLFSNLIRNRMTKK